MHRNHPQRTTSAHRRNTSRSAHNSRL